MRKNTLLLTLLVAMSLTIFSCTPDVSQEEYDAVRDELTAIQGELGLLNGKLSECEKLDKQYDNLENKYTKIEAEYEELRIKYEMLREECEKFSVGQENISQALWDSLDKYEQWVVSNEDPEWGYIRSLAYPAYLNGFAKMYLEFYKHTQDEYYEEKFFRALDYIEKNRNEDWTWNWYDGESVKHRVYIYNFQFTNLFIAAWEHQLSKVPTDAQVFEKAYEYGQKATNTINAVVQSWVESADLEYYNSAFSAFTTIANYCAKIAPDEDLIESGIKYYNLSLRGYEPSSSQWFYNQAEKDKGFYDGHSAFYQLGSMGQFMKYEREMRAIFPEQHSEFIEYLPAMMEKVSEYVLPSGTFYYTEDVPDYTEGTAVVLRAYERYDDLFGTDHTEIKNNAKNTVLQRQAANGAYYQADNEVILLWYTDSIGAGLPEYLNLIEIK